MYELLCHSCGAIFEATEGMSEADAYFELTGEDPGEYRCPYCGADEREIEEL